MVLQPQRSRVVRDNVRLQHDEGGDNLPALYATKDQGGILDPDHIAENYWYLHLQPRDAWTFELDLRPWAEKW